MIVYAGKQFWNDFNNGDEWVFQDANRPRDNDKFKLRPWLQSDKWDWKSTNKNTWAAFFNWYGFRKVNNTASLWTWYDFYRLRLKDTFTDSDLSDFEWYQQRTKTWTTAEIRDYIQKAQSIWNPKSRITDWDVEIMETGSYGIWVFAQFMRPSGHTRTTMSQMGVGLGLLQKNWSYQIVWSNMSRSCTDIDSLTYYQALYLEQGERIAPFACEWYWNGVMVIGWIYAMRIW